LYFCLRPLSLVFWLMCKAFREPPLTLWRTISLSRWSSLLYSSLRVRLMLIH
jgi:hypothetical protein